MFNLIVFFLVISKISYGVEYENQKNSLEDAELSLFCEDIGDSIDAQKKEDISLALKSLQDLPEGVRERFLETINQLKCSKNNLKITINNVLKMIEHLKIIKSNERSDFLICIKLFYKIFDKLNDAIELKKLTSIARQLMQVENTKNKDYIKDFFQENLDKLNIKNCFVDAIVPALKKLSPEDTLSVIRNVHKIHKKYPDIDGNDISFAIVALAETPVELRQQNLTYALGFQTTYAKQGYTEILNGGYIVNILHALSLHRENCNNQEFINQVFSIAFYKKEHIPRIIIALSKMTNKERAKNIGRINTFRLIFLKSGEDTSAAKVRFMEILTLVEAERRDEFYEFIKSGFNDVQKIDDLDIIENLTKLSAEQYDKLLTRWGVFQKIPIIHSFLSREQYVKLGLLDVLKVFWDIKSDKEKLLTELLVKFLNLLQSPQLANYPIIVFGNILVNLSDILKGDSEYEYIFKILPKDYPLYYNCLILDCIARIPAKERKERIKRARLVCDTQALTSTLLDFRVKFLCNILKTSLSCSIPALEKNLSEKEVLKETDNNVHLLGRDSKTSQAILILIDKLKGVPKEDIDKCFGRFLANIDVLENQKYKDVINMVLNSSDSTQSYLGLLHSPLPFGVFNVHNNLFSAKDVLGFVCYFIEHFLDVKDRENTMYALQKALYDSVPLNSTYPFCSLGTWQKIVIAVLQGRLAGVNIDESRSEFSLLDSQEEVLIELITESYMKCESINRKHINSCLEKYTVGCANSLLKSCEQKIEVVCEQINIISKELTNILCVNCTKESSKEFLEDFLEQNNISLSVICSDIADKLFSSILEYFFFDFLDSINTSNSEKKYGKKEMMTAAENYISSKKAKGVTVDHDEFMKLVQNRDDNCCDKTKILTEFRE